MSIYVYVNLKVTCDIRLILAFFNNTLYSGYCPEYFIEFRRLWLNFFNFFIFHFFYFFSSFIVFSFTSYPPNLFNANLYPRPVKV